MDEKAKEKITRIAARALMEFDVPGAPAAAVGPPSQWWSEAEAVLEAIEPYYVEALRAARDQG